MRAGGTSGTSQNPGTMGDAGVGLLAAGRHGDVGAAFRVRLRRRLRPADPRVHHHVVGPRGRVADARARPAVPVRRVRAVPAPLPPRSSPRSARSTCRRSSPSSRCYIARAHRQRSDRADFCERRRSDVPDTSGSPPPGAAARPFRLPAVRCPPGDRGGRRQLRGRLARAGGARRARPRARDRGRPPRGARDAAALDPRLGGAGRAGHEGAGAPRGRRHRRRRRTPRHAGSSATRSPRRSSCSPRCTASARCSARLSGSCRRTRRTTPSRRRRRTLAPLRPGSSWRDRRFWRDGPVHTVPGSAGTWRLFRQTLPDARAGDRGAHHYPCRVTSIDLTAVRAVTTTRGSASGSRPARVATRSSGVSATSGSCGSAPRPERGAANGDVVALLAEVLDVDARARSDRGRSGHARQGRRRRRRLARRGGAQARVRRPDMTDEPRRTPRRAARAARAHPSARRTTSSRTTRTRGSCRTPPATSTSPTTPATCSTARSTSRWTRTPR